MNQKRWEIRTKNELLRNELGEKLGISWITAQILINRGISSVLDAERFFQFDLDTLYDPFLFVGMDKAVERLARALNAQEKTVIFGDYDVDGITGTSLLWRVLQQIGGNVDYYVPDRSEGYGLNLEAVKRLAYSGYTLLITVDNGISCYNEVELANSLNVDVIITDHHEPPELIPDAVAVINPKLPQCQYPFPYLAGVGVAFKLCLALAKHLNSSELHQYIMEQLDLVTLGTVADVVSLTRENRTIVANGLQKIQQTQNSGLVELIKVAGLTDKAITAGDIGFILGPRINAIGRLDNPMLGVELLTTHDPSKAAELATKLDLANRKRQMTEEVIIKSAIAMVEAEGLDKGYAIVLASKDWNHGVIGIAASKLVERYYRPVILIAVDEAGLGKGSARGIRGLNLFAALESCKEHLAGFGGHDMAAGLAIKIERLEAFRQAFAAYVESQVRPEDLTPFLEIDTEVQLDELSLELFSELKRLEPHGPGNPRPVLTVSKVQHEFSLVGANKDHLRFQAVAGDMRVGGIGFGMAMRSKELREHPAVDVTFHLDLNLWQGREYLQMKLIDLRTPEVTLHERLFRGADNYLNRLVDSLEIEPTSRDRLAHEWNSRLMHMEDGATTTAGGLVLGKLLQGESPLLATLPRRHWVDIYQKVAAYEIFQRGKFACVLHSSRIMCGLEYLRLKDTLARQGLRVYKVAGAVNEYELGELVEVIAQGKVDLLLTTPAYAQYLWNRYEIVRDRVGSFLIAEAEEIFFAQSREWLSDFANTTFKLVALTALDRGPAERIAQSFHFKGEISLLEEGTSIPLVKPQNVSKDEYMLNILSKGEKTLVYVESPKACVELAQKVSHALPRLGEQVLYFHERLPLKEQALVEKAFSRGEASILISTGAFAAEREVGALRHLIFYQHCLHHVDFLSRCDLIRRDGALAQIHLLAGPEDLRWSQRIVETMAPERELLGKIYVFFSKIAGEQGRIVHTNEKLVMEMEKIEKIRVNPALIQVALDIMEELKLLIVERNGSNRLVTLLPKPKQKLDLLTSIRYNEGVVDKKAFGEFCQVLMTETPEKMLEKLQTKSFLGKTV